MSLFEDLESAIKTALLQSQPSLSFLRLAKSEILAKSKAQNLIKVSDQLCYQVFKSQIKKAKEGLEFYQQQPQTYSKQIKEIEFEIQALEQLLPAQLTHQQLKAEVIKIIKSTNLPIVKQHQVQFIKVCQAQLAMQASLGEVAQVVLEILKEELDV